MRTAPLIAFVLPLLFAASPSHGEDPLQSLPSWAQAKWAALAGAKGLEASTRLNPFVWRGDFDGDSKPDLVLLVRQKESKKQGIVFLFQGARAPQVLGAGTDFGNGGDDFEWMDTWLVQDRGTSISGAGAKPAKLEADALLVGKEGAASALIFLKAGKAAWLQQGD